jgi:hypothetical protein
MTRWDMSKSQARAIIPSTVSSLNMRSHLSGDDGPQTPEFLFSVRTAKGLDDLIMRFLRISITLHPILQPISSLPMWCYCSKLDFQFACCVSIGSPGAPDFFAPHLNLLNQDSEVLASAQLPAFEISRRSVQLKFFMNHKDVILRTNDGKLSCSINFSAAVSGTERENVKKLVEPSLHFRVTSCTSLMTTTAIADDSDTEANGWHEEAKTNGWLSEPESKEMWERIALSNGWLRPAQVESNSRAITELESIYLSGEPPLFVGRTDYALAKWTILNQAPTVRKISEVTEVFSAEPAWK